MPRADLLRLLLPSRKSQLSPDGRQLVRLFNEVADERNRFQRNLNYALDTIKQMEIQLAEYDFLLMQAQTQLLLRKRTSSMAQSDRAGKSSAVHRDADAVWIQDTWLCIAENHRLLGKAETTWKTGDAPQALILATQTLSSQSETVDVVDKLICRLFIAALFHCNENYTDSNDHVNIVIHALGERNFPIATAARELGGIARFIQGKNLMACGEWQPAYWALSRALHTRGYHSKARQLQREAIELCTRQEAGESVTATDGFSGL